MQDAVRLPNESKVLAAMLLGLALIGISWGTVHSPWLITGAVLGVVFLAIALVAPFVMILVMLAIGPIDLSFLTGGFKALFPEMGGLDMNGIRLLGATAGFLAFTMFEPRARAMVLSSIGRMWVVFLLFAFGSVVHSLDPLEGLRLGLKLAYPFLTFLIVVGVCDTRERLLALTRYVLFTVAFIVLVLNPILVMNGEYRVQGDITRLGGLGIGDNPFSFYCMAMMFIVFTRYVMRGQIGYLLFAALLFMWMALTQTRIAAAGAVLGLVTIGVLAAFASGNKKILLGGLLAAVIAGAILLPRVLIRSFGFVPTPVELFKLVSNPAALYESINWQGRQLLWAILWAAFMASPIIGLGLGSSTAVIRETFPNQDVKVAHNEYMRLATDAGIVGIVLFAIAVGTWLVHTVKLALRGDRLTREYAFPAVACILAWAIISITDNPFDYYTPFTQYIGFLVAGAVVMDTTARQTQTESD